MDNNKSIVTFVAQEKAPDINTTDYWIDLSEDKHGGVIKYFDKDKCSWVVIKYDPKIIEELQAWLSCALAALEREMYHQVELLNTRIDNLTTYVKENIIRLDQRIDDLKQYTDQKLQELDQKFTTQINNLEKKLQDQIDNLTQLIENLTQRVTNTETNINNIGNQLDEHAKRRDNPHVVTRDQLGLGINASVQFGRVNAPSGFHKE